jgi:hypothetical protein
MSMPSLNEPGNHLGKQIQVAVALRGSTPTQRDGKLSSGLARSLGADGLASFDTLRMPRMAVRPLRVPSCCFPHASPISPSEPGKQKAAPKGRTKQLISFRKFGAGEGIRTLDPNLGRMVFRT